MTSRNEDAFGIDMVLEDQEGRVLNIDVKTPSAFRHRMGELEFEGRMSEEEFLRADERDYFTHIHSHQGSRIERIPVTLLCIRHEPVSYTHLDVYKRQGIICGTDRLTTT